MRLLMAVGSICLLWVGSAPVFGEYGYPAYSSFFATVAGTPPELTANFSSMTVSETTLRVHSEPDKRQDVPDIFSEVARPAFKLAWQNRPAPMVFIVAGTGGRYDTQKVEFLKLAYYRHGYHVVQLSSPTSFDFIVNASRNHRPGIARQDAEDLYALMQSVQRRIQRFKKLVVTGTYLTGYSLGALNAAWVGYLDGRKKRIGFHRILLINPPVYMKVSIDNLDKLILANVPGVTDSNSLFEHYFTKLANYFRVHKSIDVDKSLLFDLQKSKKALSDEELALLIGLTFRFSVASMTFTADIMSHSGAVVPEGELVRETDSRTPYFKKVMLSNKCCSTVFRGGVLRNSGNNTRCI